MCMHQLFQAEINSMKMYKPLNIFGIKQLLKDLINCTNLLDVWKKYKSLNFGITKMWNTDEQLY